MNDYLISDFAFVGTTVDPAPVRAYLLNAKLPGLTYAIRTNADRSVIASLSYAEFVQYNLCQYIAGKQKTLFNTNRQVRDYYAWKPIVAKGVIQAIILKLRRDFLKNEWYELMPRFEKAAAKIEKLLTTL